MSGPENSSIPPRKSRGRTPRDPRRPKRAYHGPRGKDHRFSTLGAPYRWQKGGPSPNPGGRPAISISDSIRENLREIDPVTGLPNADVIGRGLVDTAKIVGRDAAHQTLAGVSMSEALRAAETVAERSDGKVSQAHEVSGPGGKEVVFRVLFDEAPDAPKA